MKGPKLSLLPLALLAAVSTRGQDIIVGLKEGITLLKYENDAYVTRQFWVDWLGTLPISGVAVDSGKCGLFFSLHGSSKSRNLIRWIPMQPKDDDKIINILTTDQGAERVVHMVYHQEEETLYWTDSKKEEIAKIKVTSDENEKHSTKGRNATVVRSLAHNAYVGGIAIDPMERLLFWTTMNPRHPSVERSDLDGSNHVVIASSGLFIPTSVAVDPSRRLYWANNAGNTFKIETSRLNGSERAVVLVDHHEKSFSLSFVPSGDDQGTLVWSDVVNRAVRKLEVSGGGGARQSPAASTLVHHFQLVPRGLEGVASFSETCGRKVQDGGGTGEGGHVEVSATTTPE